VVRIGRPGAGTSLTVFSLAVFLIAAGSLLPPLRAAACPAAAPPPQDPLAELLRKQREIAFIGERFQTSVSSRPEREDRVFRQRIRHNPPSDYRIDFLDLPDEDEYHVLVTGEKLYEWDERDRVQVRERSDDQTLGLVISDTYLDLLRKNYLIEAELGPEVADRRTYTVRIDPLYPGRPAIRAWIDSTYGVPLKVEVYTDRGQLQARYEYTRIYFRSRLDRARFDPPAEPEPRTRRGVRCETPDAFLDETGQHPPLADRLPAGFSLVWIRQGVMRQRDGGEQPFIQSFYSDGYASFSIFAEQEHPGGPEETGEEGLREVRSGQRGWFNYAVGWIENTKVTVTGDVGEAELVEVLSSVKLEGQPPLIP